MDEADIFIIIILVDNASFLLSFFYFMCFNMFLVEMEDIH